MYFGRKQRNATDYFVASHTIPWWALMLSIVATETSALTFISTPGLSYGAAPGTGNLGFLQIVAGYILGRIVVATVLLAAVLQGQDGDGVRAARAAVRASERGASRRSCSW